MTYLPNIANSLLSSQVIELLEERLLFGEWGPGTRLPTEAELGAQLGVSRSVVRDALRALSARGLVDVRQGVGTIVSEASDAAYADAAFLLLLRSGVTVHEAVQARCAIEVAVAGMAAESRTDADLEVMWAHFHAVSAAARARDMAGALESDLQFHLAILEATHLPVLITLLRPMQRIVWVTSLAPSPYEGDYDVDKHRSVLEALQLGDPELARARMSDHFAFVDDPAYRGIHSGSFRDAAKARLRLREESIEHAG
jgi:GntR family transcriptional regulator, transcriptional repressor for pyruvate dehydrogenase complex